MGSYSESEAILKVENHSKSFPGVLANDSISLDVRKGEIHCLLGENGAGKSTLAECLYGVLKPDSGKIIFENEQVRFSSPRDAILRGMGMVHQHFDLVPVMTVLENIVVGTEMPRITLNLGQAAERIKALCVNYGIDLSLNSPVSHLAVGQQQWVEILKTLYLGVNFLILDEPTAVLTPQETEKLFSILLKMKAQGLSIILITHKLNEVIEISDRVTVLRRGKVVATVTTSDTTKEELARMMVGRDVVFLVTREEMAPGVPVLEITDLHALADNRQEALHGVSLQIRRNEIVGLAGVAGNGQRELFDVIVGVRPAVGGTVKLDGEDVTNLSPATLMEQGIASIPEDRVKDGLLMGLSIRENLILGSQRTSFFRSGLFLNAGKVEEFVRKKIEEFDIATSSLDQRVRSLSGGNLQKLILARELAHNPKFVIASQPTRGLDVGAIEYVRQSLFNLRQSGAGILLISEELDELFSLSDRIAVIYKGHTMGVFSVEEVTVERVGLLMGGIRDEV